MSDYITGYALALFNIAKKEEKLIKYKNEALEIIEAINKNPKSIHIFNSKTLEVKEKIELIKKAFNKINKSLRNFLFVIAERSKFNLITSILKKLIKFINDEKNINEGIVYSTEKLSDDQLNKIQKKISNILNIKVILENKIDVNIIGGIKVQVNNDIIEDNVLSRIEQIRNELLEEREED